MASVDAPHLSRLLECRSMLSQPHVRQRDQEMRGAVIGVQGQYAPSQFQGSGEIISTQGLNGRRMGL